MKYIFFFLLIINSQLTCMDVWNLLEKRHDKIYSIAKNKKDLMRCYKNYLCYKHCITQILPIDLCKYIDDFSALVHREKIKKSFSKDIVVVESKDNYSVPHLFVSNNGRYYCHNIPYYLGDSGFRLMDINPDKLDLIKKFYAWDNHKSMVFSPNSKYCIINEDKKTALYHFANQKKFNLRIQDYRDYYLHKIIMSNDSKYILLEEFKNGNFSHCKYTLCTVDEKGIPTTIPLYLGNSDLPKEKRYLLDLIAGSCTAVFHPDSKHIIHCPLSDRLDLYTIESSENKIIKPASKETNSIQTLSNAADKKIIANTWDATKILFDIENPDKIISKILPKQITGTLPIICIPHKNLFTHMLLNTFPLQLINQEEKVVATQVIPGAAVTALATTITGDYLAVGYSNGTIMVWNLCNPDPEKFEKIYLKSKGIIEKLTFSDNQLLLSQSKSGEFWDTAEPTSTPGTAILWDVHGNEIINFGNNIVNSIMSKNGKTIIIVSAKLKATGNGISPWKRLLTLATYHNKKQPDNYVSRKEYTLTDLKKL